VASLLIARIAAFCSLNNEEARRFRLISTSPFSPLGSLFGLEDEVNVDACSSANVGNACPAASDEVIPVLTGAHATMRSKFNIALKRISCRFNGRMVSYKAREVVRISQVRSTLLAAPGIDTKSFSLIGPSLPCNTGTQ